MSKVFLRVLTLVFFTLNSAFSFDLVAEGQNTEWKNLLFFVNEKSLVTSDKFFLSPEGKYDSVKELEASVKAIQASTELEVARFACRFPRRYSYISQKLSSTPKKFYCDDHLSWRDSFEASGMSIMFASQYLENPASSFGHTYLKINSHKKALFLNKVIAFAADVPDDVGSGDYIWKGLTGGFLGKFSVHPFYTLYHEYANMEKRDIWEYELNLSHEETERLLDSLYEIVHGAEFDYMFLTNNCSALLLRLLSQEVREDFLKDMPFYVIPIQTVKVLEEKDLVRKAIFHPSITSRMSLLAKDMNRKEVKEASEFISHHQELNDKSSARTLDLGLEYINFQRQKQGGELTPNQQKDFSSYLKLRAQKPNYESPRAQGFDPSRAPKPQRFSMAAQTMNKEPTGLALSYRPVGKDFFDRPSGFVKESEVNILKTKIYLDTQDIKSSWGSVDILGIKKYGDYNLITKSASWGANLAYKSLANNGCPKCYHAELDSYYGLGKEVFKTSVLSYLVFHPTVRVGNLDHHTNFVPQGELGFIYSDERFVWKVSGFSGLIYDGYNKRSFQNTKESFSWILNDGYSLNISHEYFIQDISWNTIEAGLSFYF